MPTSIRYSVLDDSYSLGYSPDDLGTSGLSEGYFSDGRSVPGGEWTAFVSPFQLDPYGGIGIILRLEDGSHLEFLSHGEPPLSTDEVTYVLFTAPLTLRVEHFEDGTLVFSHSEDLNTWVEDARLVPGSSVSEVGLVLRYDREDAATSGQVQQARLLQGIWQHVTEEVWLGASDDGGSRPTPLIVPPPEPSVTSTTEPLVHCIVGAQFGDLEFDVGKSVRWLTWYVDNLFVLDVNLGDPRYWIVNWALTFPDAEHAVTGINFFYSPTDFRKEQWAKYKTAFGEPADDDWILFVDAHEGFSVDNRSLPNDYAFAPFKSFLWREIQRAQGLGQAWATLPYYVFLRSDNVTNVTYDEVIQDPDTPGVLQALSVPYYQAHQGLKRLWNAAALKSPSFDWSQLDTPVAPSANAKAQIISYGYAHWNLQDIEPPATTVPALTEANDDGWRMRKLLSQVRVIPGLPIGNWVSPASDPAGLPGPWAPDDFNNPDALNPTTGLPMSAPVAANAAMVGLLTPLYDTVFRINMRDGVWYEEGVSGNIPLVWDGTKWTTNYDPALWASQGVDSYDPTAVP